VTPYEEIVKHGKNGFLASSDQEWIECLQTLIAFPDMRQQIARKAQETVRKNQLLSDHANKWSKAYAKTGIESSGSQIFIGDLLNVQDAILHKIYSSQNAQSDRLQIQVEDKERLIQTLTAELEDKDRTLQSVVNSKSWALTKPLRFVGRKIQKTRKILSKDN
jgi:hypothetical protein